MKYVLLMCIAFLGVISSIEAQEKYIISGSVTDVTNAVLGYFSAHTSESISKEITF